VIEVTGDTQKIDALLKVLEPFGIKEIAQSGLLAMGRGIEIHYLNGFSRTNKSWRERVEETPPQGEIT